jgi:predicted porin
VIEVDNVSAPLADVETKTHSVLLPAWYADLGGEYWLTERTGFYVDATYQGSEAFNQNLGGRTATIDLSSASGIMSGLTLRF